MSSFSNARQFSLRTYAVALFAPFSSPAIASGDLGWMIAPLVLTPVVSVLVAVVAVFRLFKGQFVNSVFGFGLGAFPVGFWYFQSNPVFSPYFHAIDSVLKALLIYSEWNLFNSTGVLFFAHLLLSCCWLFRIRLTQPLWPKPTGGGDST